MHQLASDQTLDSRTSTREASLVEAVHSDPEAFALLYRHNVRRVYRYVYSRVNNRDDASDITSQAFADAFASLPKYRERGDFAAWLFRIVRRRCADHFRKARPVTSIVPTDATVDPYPGLDDAVDRAATVERLAEIVAGLQEDQKELLRLRFAAELTYAEIGGILGRKPPAVTMAVHRLLDRLAEELEARHEPEG